MSWILNKRRPRINAALESQNIINAAAFNRINMVLAVYGNVGAQNNFSRGEGSPTSPRRGGGGGGGLGEEGDCQGIDSLFPKVRSFDSLALSNW